MASNYTGNPAATQAPAPVPAPGSVPIVSIPSDTTDDMNSASIAQMFKVAADYLAYLFTTIMQVFFVQKPSVGVDTPQAMIKDSAGNVRALFDHLGYPGGRFSALREYWFGAIPSTSSAGAIGNTPWALTLSGTGGSVAVPAMSSTVAYAGNYINVFGNTSANAYFYLQSNGIHNPAITTLSTVVEFELGISSLTSGNGAIYAGLSNLHPDAATNAVMFQATITAGVIGNWFCTNIAAGVSTSQDSTVAAVSGATFPAVRFRLEFHGSGSPYGAKTRFFINETLVKELTTNIPTTSYQSLFFGSTNVATAASVFILGPVTATFNRWASLPAL